MPNANSFQNTLGNSFTDTLGNSGVTPNAFRQNFDNHVQGNKFNQSAFGDPFKSKNVGGHGTKTNKGGAYSETTTVSSSSSSDDWNKGFDNDSGKDKKKKSKFHNDEHKTAYKRARKYIKNTYKGSERKQQMKQMKSRNRDIDWSDNSNGDIFHYLIDPKSGKPQVKGGAKDTPWHKKIKDGILSGLDASVGNVASDPSLKSITEFGRDFAIEALPGDQKTKLDSNFGEGAMKKAANIANNGLLQAGVHANTQKQAGNVREKIAEKGGSLAARRLAGAGARFATGTAASGGALAVPLAIWGAADAVDTGVQLVTGRGILDHAQNPGRIRGRSGAKRAKRAKNSFDFL